MKRPFHLSAFRRATRGGALRTSRRRGRFAEVVDGLKLAVTGGTGTYADVSGTIAITAGENGRFDSTSISSSDES